MLWRIAAAILVIAISAGNGAFWAGATSLFLGWSVGPVFFYRVDCYRHYLGFNCCGVSR